MTDVPTLNALEMGTPQTAQAPSLTSQDVFPCDRTLGQDADQDCLTPLGNVPIVRPETRSTPLNLSQVPNVEPHSPPPDGRTDSKSKAVPEQPSPDVVRAVRKNLMLDFLNQSAARYPWLINQSDRLIFDPTTYKASPSSTNITFDTKVNSNAQLGDRELSNPFLNDLTVSHFERNRQFYWILDDNRVVVETQGTHGDFEVQGRSTHQRGGQSQQSISVTQGLFGVQSVWALPSVVSGLVGEEDERDISISSIAIEISNSANVPINSITVEAGVDLTDPQIILLDNVNFGDTFSEEGGGALFDNLDAENVPSFLQGFPTVDLRPLVEGGAFVVGQTIPLDSYTLVQDRLNTAEFSSLPGVYTLRPNTGTNESLLRVLANPFLPQAERDLNYLNSLAWFNVGFREPVVISPADLSSALADQAIDFNGGAPLRSPQIDEDDWQRFTASHSRYRALLHYDSEQPKLAYSGIFANPGLSVTVSDFNRGDLNQTFHGSLGLLLGGLYLVTPKPIETGLREAKEQLEKLETFGRLQTKASKQQRRAMNVRLNQTLRQASNTSSLHQVSGSWTFDSQTTPQHSQLFQLRTGLYRRGVQFFSADVNGGAFTPVGLPFISQIRNSSNDFGPLTFRGELFPIETTAIDDIERTFAAQTIIRTPEETIVASAGFPRQPQSTTTVPLIDPSRPFDLTFDVLELTQLSQRILETNSDSYNGYLYLPAVELLMAGSRGKFNYGVALGSWVNLTPDAAPGVANNQADELDFDSLTEEPTLGGYAKLSASATFKQTQLDEKNQVRWVASHVPFVSLSWNSSASRLNPISAIAGYQYAWRDRNLGISLTPSFIVTSESSDLLSMFRTGRSNPLVTANNNGQFSTNIFGRFFTSSGFNQEVKLEFGDEFFLDTKATYKIIKDKEIGTLALGGYYSNYNTINQGLSSRASDTRLGLLADYTLPQSNVSLNVQLGHSDTGFEMSLGGQLKFSF